MSSCICNVEDLLNKASFRLEWESRLKCVRGMAGKNGSMLKNVCQKMTRVRKFLSFTGLRNI